MTHLIAPLILLQEYAASGWEMPSAAVNSTDSTGKTDIDKDNNGSSGDGATLAPSPSFFKSY